LAAHRTRRYRVIIPATARRTLPFGGPRRETGLSLEAKISRSSHFPSEHRAMFRFPAIMTETVSGMRPYFDHQARHGSLSVPVEELSFNNSVPRVINHCPTRLFPSWDSIVVRLGRNCCLRLGSNFLSLLHLALVDIKICVNLLDVVVVVDGFVEF